MKPLAAIFLAITLLPAAFTMEYHVSSADLDTHDGSALSPIAPFPPPHWSPNSEGSVSP